MRTTTLLPALALCALGSTVLGLSRESESAPAAFVRVTPEQLQWHEVPDSHGVQMATVAGDPSGPGVYVVRVRFPPHVMDRPHWHPHDRYVTVLKGTWYTGTGATFDPHQAVPLKPGSYMFHPARGLHWDGSNSDEEVMVQIFGVGPADTTPADPSQPFWVQLPR